MERRFEASCERLFDAFTRVDWLKQWWGPPDAPCVSAEVDLRLGGEYRLVHEPVAGGQIIISGRFEVIERPSVLVYTWRTAHTGATQEPMTERVRVTFTSRPSHSIVRVVHERIATEAERQSHTAGWEGCLAGLRRWLMHPAG